MCQQIAFSFDTPHDDRIETLAGLADVMPGGLAVDLVYARNGLTEERLAEIARDEGHICICPVDVEETARRNGYEVARRDWNPLVVFRKKGEVTR